MITTRRIGALARAEAVLLRRNPTALGGALVLPAVLALLPAFGSDSPVVRDSGLAVMIVLGLSVFTLTFGVYYNLVTALVARREEFVLKRLRTGEISDGEILAGTAAPVVAIAWFQIAVGVVAGFFLDRRAPSNPLLVLVAIGLGTVLCILLAAAVTVVTSTVSVAQLTATPLVVVSQLLCGVMIPLDTLPDPVGALVPYLPMNAVVTLIRLGLTGTTPSGEALGLVAQLGSAVVPVIVLGVWIVGVGAIVQRWFRWEPRR